MRKCRKSKDTKGTKKETKDKEKDKSGSKKTARKKKDVKEKEKEGAVGKSTRSMRKAKTKKNAKKNTDSKSEVEIFDPYTFAFKVDTSLVPEADNHTPTQATTFEAFATSVLAAGVEGLIKEYFEQIATFVPTGYFERTVFDQNTALKKNRYKDVVCNDKTRVILHDGRPGDYIHANYVKGTKFILTQGPLKDTLVDFWRMIVQEGVSAICMLCELVENGKPKCEVYFPEATGQSLNFGDIVVTCDEATQQDTHTQLKNFTVTDKKAGKGMKVIHYKIISWPDKTVAVSNLSILRTHRLLRRLPGPSVIHCSAGVGRTGTFAAIEIGVQCLLNGRTFQVAELVKALRHCRLLSVQMDTQYLMLAEAIMDCGVSFKYIEDSKLVAGVDTFKDQVNEYVKAHPPPFEKPAPTITPTVEKPIEETPPTPRQSGSGRSPRRSKEKVHNAIPQSPRGSKERAFRSEKPPTPAASPAPPPPVTPPPPAPAPTPPVPAPTPSVPPPPATPTPAVAAPAVTPPKPATPPPALPNAPSKPHVAVTPAAPPVTPPKPVTPAPATTPPPPAPPPIVPAKPAVIPIPQVASPANPTPAATPALKPVTPPTPTTPPTPGPPLAPATLPMSTQTSPNKPTLNPNLPKSQYIV